MAVMSETPKLDGSKPITFRKVQYGWIMYQQNEMLDVNTVCAFTRIEDVSDYLRELYKNIHGDSNALT